MKRILILILIAFLVVLCTTFTVTYIYRTKAETVTYTFIEDGQEMSFNMDIIDELTCNVYAELGDERLERNGMFYHYDGDLLTLWYFDDKDKMVLELTFDENNVIVDMNDYVDEYHMTMEEMAVIFNEKYAELNTRWTELKESQTYTMLVTIVTLAIGFGYSIVAFSKKVKQIKPTEDGLNETIKEVIRLKSDLNEIVSKIKEANGNQETYKKELDGICESIRIMACNDRDMVIDGTSKVVCDILGGDSDAKDKA